MPLLKKITEWRTLFALTNPKIENKMVANHSPLPAFINKRDTRFVMVDFMGLNDLIANKKAVAREKDLNDIANLIALNE